MCGGCVCGFAVGESLSLLPPAVLLTDDVGCLAGGGSFEALDGELALDAGAGGSSSSSSAHPSAIVCICEGGRTCCIISPRSDPAATPAVTMHHVHARVGLPPQAEYVGATAHLAGLPSQG